MVKIRGKLLYFTRFMALYKFVLIDWCTAFPLVLNLLTLNDLGHYFALFHWMQDIWGPVMPQWLKVNPHYLQGNCSSTNLVFGSVWFMVIFSEVTGENALKRDTSHLTVKIQIVQDCAAMMDAIAEFLLWFVPHTGSCVTRFSEWCTTRNWIVMTLVECLQLFSVDSLLSLNVIAASFVVIWYVTCYAIINVQLMHVLTHHI